jgi:hypothetical protein
MPSALTRARLVSDKQLDLDKHRGMAEQKATDIRRILHDVEWRVRKRHVRRTSLPPRDRCICGRVGRCERSSKSQHAGVKVETGTFPVAPPAAQRAAPRHRYRTRHPIRAHLVAGQRVQRRAAPKVRRQPEPGRARMSAAFPAICHCPWSAIALSLPAINSGACRPPTH